MLLDFMFAMGGSAATLHLTNIRAFLSGTRRKRQDMFLEVAFRLSEQHPELVFKSSKKQTCLLILTSDKNNEMTLPMVVLIVSIANCFSYKHACKYMNTHTFRVSMVKLFSFYLFQKYFLHY